MNDKKQLNNAKWLFIIAIGIYVISSVFSILFYTDGTYTVIGKYLSGAMAILAQIVTYAFPSLGIVLIFKFKSISDNKGIRFTSIVTGVIVFIIGLVLILYSIIASSGFLYIEKEKKNSTAYKNSEAYKIAEKDNIRYTNKYNETDKKIQEKEEKLKKLEHTQLESLKSIDNKYSKKSTNEINSNAEIAQSNREIEKYKALNRWTNKDGGVYIEQDKIKLIQDDIRSNNFKLAELEKAEYRNLIKSLKSELAQLKKERSEADTNINISSDALKANRNNKETESSYDGYYKSLLPDKVAMTLSSKTLLVLSGILELAPTLLIYVSVVLYGFDPIKWVMSLWVITTFSGLFNWISSILRWVLEIIGIKMTAKVSNMKLRLTESGMTAYSNNIINEIQSKANIEMPKVNLEKTIAEAQAFIENKNKRKLKIKKIKAKVKEITQKQDMGIENKVLEKVYQIMKESRYKDGHVKGIPVLAKKLNMKDKEVQHMHALLRKMDKIYTKDKKTYLKG